MRTLVRILTPLTAPLAVLLPAGAANADPPDIQTGHEFFTEINACNGESVSMEGDFRIIDKRQEDGDAVQHVLLRAKGTGNQGNEYVLHVDELFKDDADRELVQHRVLISQGSVPNQDVLIVLNFNTGEISIEAVCRG
jgi:hypothetical protein